MCWTTSISRDFGLYTFNCFLLICHLFALEYKHYYETDIFLCLLLYQTKLRFLDLLKSKQQCLGILKLALYKCRNLFHINCAKIWLLEKLWPINVNKILLYMLKDVIGKNMALVETDRTDCKNHLCLIWHLSDSFWLSLLISKDTI